jgi:hypothetical protein
MSMPCIRPHATGQPRGAKAPWRIWAALVLPMVPVLLTATAGVQAAEPELTREARIKAVLTLRMVKFVEWPAEVLSRNDSLQICTWGDGATSSALQSLQGQKVREHEVRVRKLQPAPVPDTKGCHVLFVADSVRADFNPNALYGAANRALLSISDMPDFGKRGGIISLVQQDNKIGFEVQLRHARASGLQIGAPLLELARSVE